jgi:hypothetical protein
MHLHPSPSATSRQALESEARSVPHVGAPVTTTTSQADAYTLGQERRRLVLMHRRMGHRVVDEALAVFTELALPLAGGAALGTVLGLGVCRVAVPRLDTLRQLQPPARVVVDPAALIPLGLAAVAALGVLTVIGVVSVVRARPMEVLRATA